MTADLKGGYYWVARMRNGETVEQRRRDGSEISVERLRTDPRPLAQLHLIPISPKHPYIRLQRHTILVCRRAWVASFRTQP
jgi:hypothetical protein